MKLNTPRGTHVLFGEEALRFETLTETFKKISRNFGFTPMATPIFEFSQVFTKSLGEGSDIVSKEMYSFQDRNGESFTLRPEGTAGIARAFVSDGLSQHSPFKVYYHGPMFRYERPQKGRQRQFHQLGVENIGGTMVFSDLEVIDLGFQFLSSLKIMDRCELLINSIGDEESRHLHREQFVKYMTKFEKELSEESQKRLQTNPLRIFDSKDPNDQKLVSEAPLLKDSLNEESLKIKDQIFEGLTRLNIPFKSVDGLVRGLDYYTHVVFEFVTSDLGAQGAVLAGGRYDHLISQMGGPEIGGVGFGAGIERLALLYALNESDSKLSEKDLMIIPVHSDLEMDAFLIGENLRKQGFSVFTHFSGNLSKRMKKASSQNVRFVLMLGPDELKSRNFKLKNLSSGEQFDVSETELAQKLKNLLRVPNS